MQREVITIPTVERMQPKEADKALADTCLFLANRHVTLNEEVETLKTKVAQLEQQLRMR